MIGSDYVSLPKRLQQAWSAPSVTRQLSIGLLEDLISKYKDVEKKVKMRVMLSFIGLDATKKNELTVSLKRFLQLAKQEESSEPWVAITAQLVHERLYGGAPIGRSDGFADDNDDVDNGSGGVGKDMLKETSETILSRLLSASEDASALGGDLSSYFQPLEFRYLQPSWVSAQLPGVAIKNTDFHFTGSAPDFIAREKERQRLDHNSGRASLMRVKMPEPMPDPSSSSNSSNTMRDINRITSLEASKKAKLAGGGAGPRVQAKMISLDVLQAKKAAEQEKQTGKRKSMGAANAAASSSSAAAAAAAASTASSASTSGSAPPTTTTSTTAKPQTPQGAAGAKPQSSLHDGDAAASVSSNNPLEALDTLAAAALQGPGTDASAAVAAATAAAAPSNRLDVDAVFAEYPLVAEEDKTMIRNFFGEENPYPASDPPRRIKLSETVTQHGRETVYMVLHFDSRTYQKTKKVKKGK